MSRYQNPAIDARPGQVRRGILLVNLGTPDAPTTRAVRRYLAQFLSDPRVVDLPAWIWKPLLFLILIFRSPRSAALYRKIWTPGGSPLLVITTRLADALQHEAGENFRVRAAMRYGIPEIGNVLQSLLQEGVRDIVVIPLYPQYSATTTASVFDGIAEALSVQRVMPRITLVNDYYRERGYIDALANSVRSHWESVGRSRKLLFSFHGIPRRYADAGDPYPGQCEETATLVAGELGLDTDEWQLVYQSRFGREEWLQPYCDETLTGLPAQGIESVDIICPGFATDCLETLDEINRENRELFIHSGGETYSYIPCLNDSSAHVTVLADIAGITDNAVMRQ